MLATLLQNYFSKSKVTKNSKILAFFFQNKVASYNTGLDLLSGGPLYKA